ncbi:MAG: hypothetical protein EAZ89_18530 [Bacteroidetes bacterium]|nr:MAG: hypothetical protein EAZ89_18530 [Bacteroidota bacterium]
MRESEIQDLMRSLPALPAPQLVETHISWVILAGDFAWKIKKPLTFSFFDASTPELRQDLCRRELLLNQSLAASLYIGLEEIRSLGGSICFGGDSGEVIDVAVKMHRMKPGSQMDEMLIRGLVRPEHIKALALRLATFHKEAKISYDPVNLGSVRQTFNDLSSVGNYVAKWLGSGAQSTLKQAIAVSDNFLLRSGTQLQQRSLAGFQRLGHGDLHAGNVFFTPDPLIYDCIEFDDELRKADVLSELAFVCMELDFYQQPRLESIFLRYYLSSFPCMGEEDTDIFRYYKLCRANVRAKVKLLRHQQHQKAEDLAAAAHYFALMQTYVQQLQPA